MIEHWTNSRLKCGHGHSFNGNRMGFYTNSMENGIALWSVYVFSIGWLNRIMKNLTNGKHLEKDEEQTTTTAEKMWIFISFLPFSETDRKQYRHIDLFCTHVAQQKRKYVETLQFATMKWSEMRYVEIKLDVFDVCVGATQNGEYLFFDFYFVFCFWRIAQFDTMRANEWYSTFFTYSPFHLWCWYLHFTSPDMRHHTHLFRNPLKIE